MKVYSDLVWDTRERLGLISDEALWCNRRRSSACNLGSLYNTERKLSTLSLLVYESTISFFTLLQRYCSDCGFCFIIVEYGELDLFQFLCHVWICHIFLGKHYIIVFTIIQSDLVYLGLLFFNLIFTVLLLAFNIWIYLMIIMMVPLNN